MRSWTGSSNSRGRAASLAASERPIQQTQRIGWRKNNHPAVKAIIPRFPDFGPYADLYFPGGIFHVAFGKGWGEAVKEMDLNVPRGDPPRGVKPVDDGSLLEMTIDARRNVPGVFEGLSQVTFRDDRPEVWGVSMLDWSIHTHLDDLEVATTPSREEQLFESLCYFDHYLKGRDNGTPEKELIYYTLGEEAWKTTDVWPPQGFDTRRYYFSENESLASEPPSSASGRFR